MRTILAGAFALGLAFTPAFADGGPYDDYDPAPVNAPEADNPSTDGWYLNGEGGVNFQNDDEFAFRKFHTDGSVHGGKDFRTEKDNGFAAGGSFGYRDEFAGGDWAVRYQGTALFLSNEVNRVHGEKFVHWKNDGEPEPFTHGPFDENGNVNLPSTDESGVTLRAHRNTVLATGDLLVEFGPRNTVVPYAGLGAGAARVEHSVSREFKGGVQSASDADWYPVLVPQAGVLFRITDNLDAFTNYRYVAYLGDNDIEALSGEWGEDKPFRTTVDVGNEHVLTGGLSYRF